MNRLLLVTLLSLALCQDWPCSKAEAGAAFSNKTYNNPPLPLSDDPYKTCTGTCLDNVKTQNADMDTVCGYKYYSADKSSYHLSTFPNKD